MQARARALSPTLPLPIELIAQDPQRHRPAIDATTRAVILKVLASIDLTALLRGTDPIGATRNRRIVDVRADAGSEREEVDDDRPRLTVVLCTDPFPSTNERIV